MVPRFKGEYIAPEKIELCYANHPLISQIFIWGNSLQCYNVAIIVPDETQIVKYFKIQANNQYKGTDQCNDQTSLD